jgi:glycine/D-amino acid oxidase-like deaminating enzyme
VANGNCLNTDIENGNVSNENIQNEKTPNSDRKNGDVPQEHNPTKEDHLPPGFFLPPKPPPPTSSLPPSTCHAVFTTDPSNYSPELFSRLPSTIYLAGLNSATYPLPALPTDRIIHAPSIELLKATARRLLGDDVVVEREAVCWRPVTRRGTPVVGGVEGERGVWVAAGHGAWGICLSLGTGWVVAEMVRGVVPRVDVGLLGL